MLQDPPFRLRSLVPSVYAPTLLYSIGLGLLLPVVPLFAKDLGAAVGLVGLTVAMRGVGTMAGDVPWGMAVTRFGAKRAMVIGTAGTAVVAILTGLASDIGQLIALMFLNGAVWSLFSIAQLTFMADGVPIEHRGRAISLVGGVNRAGLLVGPVAGGLIASAFGLEAVFFVQAAISVATLVLLASWVPDAGRRVVEAGGGHAHTRLGQTLSVHRRTFLTAGVAAVTLVLIRNARQVLIPLWGDSIGLDVAEIGLVFGVASAVDTMLFYPAGIVMDRRGRKWTSVPSMLALSGSLALVPLTGSFASFMMVGLLSGFGNGLGSGAVMTLGADLAPRDRTGEFLGVWRLITDSGSVAGPVAIGALAQALTLAAAALVTAGVGLAGAAVMLFLAAETLRRPERALAASHADDSPDGGAAAG